jgi:hypothetical protein
MAFFIVIAVKTSDLTYPIIVQDMLHSDEHILSNIGTGMFSLQQKEYNEHKYIMYSSVT